MDVVKANNVNTCREVTTVADTDHKMKAIEEIVETNDHKCKLEEKEVCGLEVKSLTTLKKFVQFLEKMRH